MATSQSITIFPEALQSIASSTITGTYQAVGAGLVNPARIIKFTNNTDEDVTLSWDGINDHDYIPMGSFLLLDVSTNRQISNIFSIAAKTVFYVKGTAGEGNFYISSYYAE